MLEDNMNKKPKSSENKAKDVETPKLKRVDIPNAARVEIARMSRELDNYIIAGVVAGMKIKGRWSVDVSTMQFIVEDKVDE